MCTTCGCSGDGAIVTVLGAHSHTHDHEHTHEHHHDHANEHGHDHVHEGHDARMMRLELDILEKNDRLAERNRGWLEARAISAWNLMSSPGAGKTTLLERTLRDLGGEIPMAVVEGDQATLNDSERIRATGAPVVQINTGSGCHLDASMMAAALKELDPPQRSLLVIENVGNLVCPALFDLGERGKIVILSVTEGDDKPLKYPHMFRACELMILNKIDLLPYVTFDVGRCVAAARRVNPRLQIMELSATRGDGLARWYEWLRERRLPAMP